MCLFGGRGLARHASWCCSESGFPSGALGVVFIKLFVVLACFLHIYWWLLGRGIENLR
jgi:hypothetical protein